MKYILTRFFLIAALAFGSVAFAQNNAPASPLTIKGDLRITYNTRTQLDGSKPRAGVVDTYAMNVNIANSAIFKGTINHLPYVANTVTADQVGRVVFDLDLDVVNPNNPAQTRNIGKMFGSSVVDKANVYRYQEGSVKVAVFGIGAAKGFESKFGGLALGKPPASSGFAKLKQDAVRLVSSKGGAITLTKYDKMSLENHVLPAGPVQIYPEVTTTGTMFFDYGRNCWHFNNLVISYGLDGRRMSDILSGNIRWVESAQRKTNGEGEYVFDVRVNEPLPTEGAVFAATASEEAFFQNDDTTSALTGTMKYKDQMAGGVVTSSAVQINLVGNRLTKQQVMYLAKLMLFTFTVPLNAE